MKTKYEFKRLLRTGAMFAAVLSLLLTFSFMANAQSSLTVDIECYGTVKVKAPGNLEAYAVIEGPVNDGPTVPSVSSPNQIVVFKEIAEPGFRFVEWVSGGGFVAPVPFDAGPPLYPPVGNPDPQGYEWVTTVNGDVAVKAVFELDWAGVHTMTMTPDFAVNTIPGTDPDAQGTPVIVEIEATYPIITPGDFPGVSVDALLQTDRTNGFEGLRVLDITPNPGGMIFPIELDNLGDAGNDIFVSDIFAAGLGIPSWGAPTLESQSGATVNWEVTLDGIMTSDIGSFTVTVSTVAYKDKEDGFDLCLNTLESTDIAVTVADVVSQDLNPAPLALDPVQIVSCGGPFEFLHEIEYPLIENIGDDIESNGAITSTCDLEGATINWEVDGDLSASGSYLVPGGGLPAYLDVIVGGTIPLEDLSELELEWYFEFEDMPVGTSTVTIQPIAQLDGVDYPYGEAIVMVITNMDITPTVGLDILPTSIYTATKTPIILPIETDFPEFNACDLNGLTLDGRFSIASGTFPAGFQILDARLGGTSITGNYPYDLNGETEVFFSDLFDAGWPANVADLDDAGLLEWEFDFAGADSPTDFFMVFELFTEFDGAEPCQVAVDQVYIEYNDAELDGDDLVSGCLNDPIDFEVVIEYPQIENIEPAPASRITADAIINVDRDVPNGTVLDWDYNGGFNSTYEFDGSEPTPLYLSHIILNSTPAGIANTPFEGHDGLIDTWSFSMTIPNTNNDDALDNAGIYNIGVTPVVQLSPYDDFIYVGTHTVTVDIPIYELTMAANPPFAVEWTDPSIDDNPHLFGCGAIIDIDTEPSVLGGWTFEEWTSDAACVTDVTSWDEHDSFQNATLAATKYRMPDCDATVTANFNQNEYTFTVGVIGCDQKVNVLVDGFASPFQLTGNRACAPIEPVSGTYLTFTHGETIILEIVPTAGWTWGSWLYCDETPDPLLDDSDFTYLGMVDGKHRYELVFRSDKELYAKFLKNLVATVFVDDKIYDATTDATINVVSSTFTGLIDPPCPSYGPDVELDFSGATATFEDKHSSWIDDPVDGLTYLDKDVDITGVTLMGADADDYILNTPGFDPLTGYGIGKSDYEAMAKIFRKEVTVTASAADKEVYDGNTDAVVTGTVSGFEALDNPGPPITVTGSVSSAGTFASADVGTWEVAYSASLAGVDAPNYILPDPLATITATISCRTLVRENLVAQTREYDGTKDATITGWGNWQTGVVGEGLVSGDIVTLLTAGYDAEFVDPWIGTKTVVVTGLSLGGADAGNYCLVHYGEGTIVVPAYAMFDPSYELACDPDCGPDITDVKVEDPFTIEFSRDIFTNQGLDLPSQGSGLGNFVRLEKWVGDGEPTCDDENYAPNDDWVPVPFFSTRNGRVITVTPGTPGPNTPVNLEWGTYYRLRHGDIWAENSVTGDLQPVIYRLDTDEYGEFDEELPCALEPSLHVIFKTIDQLYSGVVEPFGCEEVPAPGEDPNIAYDADIKITFVNPVKYTNTNLITDEPGEPTHKFQLQAKPKGTSDWEDVLFEATASEFVTVNGESGPTVITLVPLASQGNPMFMNHPAGEMLHCHDYRVLWRDGMADAGAGFVDLTDGGRVGADGVNPDQEWWWCTTCDFDLHLAYTANNAAVFPNHDYYLDPIPNNMFLMQGATTLIDLNEDGSNHSPNGKIDTYTATKDEVYQFKATPGEGYHISSWNRNGTSIWYNSGSWAYQNTSPGISWSLFTTQNNATINWTADPAVPFFEYQWNVNFNINQYRVNAYASPSQSPTASGVRINSGGSFFTNTTTGLLNHGTSIGIDSRPKDGYYATNWSFMGNSSYLAPYVGTNTDWTYDPMLVTKPEWISPPDGELTFDLIGPDITHNSTYSFRANFAVFNPRIDVAVFTSDGTPGEFGYVNFTTQFVQGEDWGIIFTADNYAVFKYGTPVKLEPVSTNCGWEFDRYEIWDGVDPDTRMYVYDPNFDPSIFFAITQNWDIHAYFKRVVFPVTVTTDPNSLASVLLEGENADGDQVSVLSNSPDPVVGDDFIFETVITLTVYPEPGYEVKSWNNPYVTLVDTYIDRSVWEYNVGAGNCAMPMDLEANIGLRQYQISGVPEPSPYAAIPKQGTVTGDPGVNHPTVQLNRFTNRSTSSIGTAVGMFEHFVTGHSLTATPVANFKFDYWYDIDKGVILSGRPGEPNVLDLPMVMEPRNIMAYFSPDLPTYPATVSVSPAEAGYTSPSTGTYNFVRHRQINEITSQHTFTAYPVIGWEFVDWSISGLTLATTAAQQNLAGYYWYPNPADESQIRFNMPSNPVSLEANFKKIDYTIDGQVITYLRPVGSCNIVNYGGYIIDHTGQASYVFGDVVDLEAVAAPGFEFVNFMVGTWDQSGCILTGRQINTNGLARFDYTIPPQWGDEVVIYAIFREQTFPAYPKYTLTTSTTPDNDMADTYGDGTYVETIVALVDQMDADPLDGYGFQNWRVNGVNVGQGVGPMNEIEVNMNGNKNVVAEYGLITYTLTVIAKNNQGFVTANGTGPAGSVVKEFNIESDPITVGASPATHFAFSHFSYDYYGLDPVVDVLNNPVTNPFGFIPVPNNVTIYAQFVEVDYNVTLEVRRDDCNLVPVQNVGGTAEIIAGTPPFYSGDVITVKATAASGYQFKHWTDANCNVIITQEQFNYTIEGHVTLIAVFEALPITVTVATDPVDAVLGATGAGTYYVADDIDLVATNTNAAKYTFLGWYENGGLVSPNMMHTVQNIPYVTPRHFVAMFELNKYNLDITEVGPGSVTANPPQPVDGYDYGTVVTLTADPAGIFAGWSGDLSGTANPTTITMLGDRSVTATFNTCDMVTDLEADGITAKRATISWTAVAGAVGYELRVNGGSWMAATSPYQLMGLMPDTDYEVEVRTVCGASNFSNIEEVEFTTYRLGDVNCDGVINVQDVSILIGYIMDSANPTPCVEDAADFNEDGDVNVLDVVMLIQYILDGGSKAAPQSNTADIYLTPDMIRFESDGTLSGLQFELQGTNMDAVNLEMALEGYQLVYKSDGYTITGMIFSMDNQVIPAGMIDLMSVSGVSQIGWGEVFAANIGKQVEVNTHGATKGEFTLAVYPNPTRNLSDLTINFTLPTDAKVNLRLLDMSGRVVADLADAVFSKGMYPITLTDAAVVNPGVYFLQMTAMPENQRGELFRSEVKVVIIK